MRKKIFCLSFVGFLISATVVGWAGSKTLVGEWEVKKDVVPEKEIVYEPGERTVTYHLTGNGSALVEEFHGGRGMATVYHMDGADLRMTHYCGAENQPRMEAAIYDPVLRTLKFDFVDVTNLTEPEAYHTRKLEIHFQDKDQIQLKFSGRRKGEEISGVVWLSRLP